jgi:hypothetical protein
MRDLQKTALNKLKSFGPALVHPRNLYSLFAEMSKPAIKNNQ